MSDLPSGSFLLGLSSVIWREAWKYGERAFRYCQHDMGHAVAALRLSAVLCGWRLKLVSTWSTDDVATLLGLNREDEFLHEEPEESELLAVVMPNSSGANIASKFPPPADKTIDEIRTAQWYGRPNRLSREHVAWPVIDEVAVGDADAAGHASGRNAAQIGSSLPAVSCVTRCRWRTDHSTTAQLSGTGRSEHRLAGRVSANCWSHAAGTAPALGRAVLADHHSFGVVRSPGERLCARALPVGP